jgi:Fic family protein
MFKIIFDKYFEDYDAQITSLKLHLALPESDTPVFASDSFSFYTSVASVYSSKIEGDPIDANSYMKHKYMGVKFKPNYTKKTDDLFKAYTFASKNRLNTENIFKAHTLITKNILHKSQQGNIRTGIVQVLDEHDRINYIGTNPFTVQNEFNKLFEDIEQLLLQDLSHTQTFYYAAVIHLLFLKIHPFNDGNGRTARLLEKWFLTEKLNEKAWFVPSEKYYYQHLNDYYKNLQKLGFEYETLNYDRCLSFLLMLPSSLNQAHPDS